MIYYLDFTINRFIYHSSYRHNLLTAIRCILSNNTCARFYILLQLENSLPVFPLITVRLGPPQWITIIISISSTPFTVVMLSYSTLSDESIQKVQSSSFIKWALKLCPASQIRCFATIRMSAISAS